MVGLSPSGSRQKPSWLEALLSARFFVNCEEHLDTKKNERNVFCVDCSDSICQHCVSDHVNHCLLQIRRYVYHDVIRLQDIQKFFDCGHVQPYIINSARVIFLNERPQPRQSKGLSNTCESCERTLQDPYRYCSLGCKVDAIFKAQINLPDLFPRCGKLKLPEACDPSAMARFKKPNAELQGLSPNSTLHEFPSGASSASTAHADELDCQRAVTSIDITLQHPLKRVRSGLPNTPGSSSQKTAPMGCRHRRKGIACRAPFF